VHDTSASARECAVASDVAPRPMRKAGSRVANSLKVDCHDVPLVGLQQVRAHKWEPQYCQRSLRCGSSDSFGCVDRTVLRGAAWPLPVRLGCLNVVSWEAPPAARWLRCGWLLPLQATLSGSCWQLAAVCCTSAIAALVSLGVQWLIAAMDVQRRQGFLRNARRARCRCRCGQRCQVVSIDRARGVLAPKRRGHVVP